MRKVIVIDDVEEPVKRFLERLEPSSEASMVEMDGRRVYLVVRSTAEGAALDEPWTDEKNRRRAKLIDKEMDGTMAAMEAVELEELTQQLRRHREKVAPLPLEYARQLLEQLTTKTNSSLGQNGDPL